MSGIFSIICKICIEISVQSVWAWKIRKLTYRNVSLFLFRKKNFLFIQKKWPHWTNDNIFIPQLGIFRIGFIDKTNGIRKKLWPRMGSWSTHTQKFPGWNMRFLTWFHFPAFIDTIPLFTSHQAVVTAQKMHASKEQPIKKYWKTQKV